MCGRFGLFAELGDLAGHFGFGAEPLQASYLPRWNIPPTSPILTVFAAGDARTGSMMRWGLTSSRGRSSKSGPRLLFNARSETIDQRPIFRNAFATRRCLVPANGFYEWQPGSGRAKTPQWVSHQQSDPVAFAGIWYTAQPQDDGEAACVIITTEANELLAPIHHRMPVILQPDQFDLWLSDQAEPSALLPLLSSRDWPEMSARQVSSAVNRVANDGPHLIDDEGPTETRPRLFD